MKNLRKTFAGIFGDMQELAGKKRGRSDTGSVTSVSTQNQTPSSVTSTTSSSSVFKYDQTSTNTTNAAISTSNNNLTKTDFTMSNLESTTIDENASATSSSNVFSASMGPNTTTQVSSTSYSQFQSTTLNPSERINPFDKNKQPSETTASKPVDTTATTSVTSYASTSSATAGSTLDDLAKSRYDKYQGSQSQSSSRYATTTTTSSDSFSSDTLKNTTSTVYGSSSYTTTGSDLTRTDSSSTSTVVPSADYNSKKPDSTTKPVQPNQRTSAAKYAFGSAQYSTGSFSDSEIIFGSTDIPDSTSKRSQFGSNVASTMDAPDSIYQTNRTLSSYNRSLSVSSDTNGDFANDPRVNTSYRIYEGIQNAAFQDYDSPVKTAATTSETATSYTSTYVSGSKMFDNDDDYDDLK